MAASRILYAHKGHSMVHLRAKHSSLHPVAYKRRCCLSAAWCIVLSCQSKIATLGHFHILNWIITLNFRACHHVQKKSSGIKLCLYSVYRANNRGSFSVSLHSSFQRRLHLRRSNQTDISMLTVTRSYSWAWGQLVIKALAHYEGDHQHTTSENCVASHFNCLHMVEMYQVRCHCIAADWCYMNGLFPWPMESARFRHTVLVLEPPWSQQDCKYIQLHMSSAKLCSSDSAICQCIVRYLLNTLSDKYF